MHGEHTFFMTDVAICVAKGTRQDSTQGIMVSSCIWPFCSAPNNHSNHMDLYWCPDKQLVTLGALQPCSVR